MRLTIRALNEIKERADVRAKLALVLDCTDFTILRYLRDNNDNLTKAAALEVIKLGTGLKENEILTENKGKVTKIA